MDTAALVKEAQNLIHIMDDEKLPPKGAVLVNNLETDAWRLWIVPSDKLTDKRDFYAKISSIIVGNSDKFSMLDAGDVDLRLPTHIAIQGLSRILHVNGLSSIHMNGSTFNGFYLPEGIVLRMAL